MRIEMEVAAAPLMIMCVILSVSCDGWGRLLVYMWAGQGHAWDGIK